MGLRLRKSVSLGKNLRINASKSGIGYSIGIKGARATKLSNGRKRATLSIPNSGISYVKETTKNNNDLNSHKKIDNNLNYNYDYSTHLNTSMDKVNYHNAAKEFKDALDNYNGIDKKEFRKNQIHKVNTYGSDRPLNKIFMISATNYQIMFLILLFPISIITSSIIFTIIESVIIPDVILDSDNPLIVIIFLSTLFISMFAWSIYVKFFSARIKVTDTIMKMKKIMYRKDYNDLLKDNIIFELYNINNK